MLEHYRPRLSTRGPTSKSDNSTHFPPSISDYPKQTSVSWKKHRLCLSDKTRPANQRSNSFSAENEFLSQWIQQPQKLGHRVLSHGLSSRILRMHQESYRYAAGKQLPLYHTRYKLRTRVPAPAQGLFVDARHLSNKAKGFPARSTQDCSGNWAHELRPCPKSSALPIPEMYTILVSAEELAHNKESGSRSAKRADGSARATMIAPEVGKEC